MVPDNAAITAKTRELTINSYHFLRIQERQRLIGLESMWKYQLHPNLGGDFTECAVIAKYLVA